MNNDNTGTHNDAGVPPAPPEAHPRAVGLAMAGAGLEQMRFLVRVCRVRAYAQPLLILDPNGGHFTTVLECRGFFNAV